jgi:hypothetical protein
MAGGAHDALACATGSCSTAPAATRLARRGLWRSVEN